MVSHKHFGPSCRAFLSVASIGAHSGAKGVRDIATRCDVVGRSVGPTPSPSAVRSASRMSTLIAAGPLIAGIAVLAASKRARESFFGFVWSTLGLRAAVHNSMSGLRAAVLKHAGDLSGRVLEVGSGDGAHLKFLCGPTAPRVRHVTCCEPNPYFHRRLRRAMDDARLQAAAAGIDVTLRLFPGTLKELVQSDDGKDGYDVIACWLVLCSVPDPVAESVRDCARLLKKSGRLLYLEHVAGRGPRLRWLQQFVQPLYNLLGDGCQLCRETGAALSDKELPWKRVHHQESEILGGLLPMVCGVCVAK